MENEIVGIVCHDAGGGEVVSSYCKSRKSNYIYYLEGPSIRIFKRKLSVESENNLQDLVVKSNHLILGTSGRSNLEIEAIKLAKKQGKKTICILDDYLNIRERFTRNDSTVLPDEIIVTDNFTHEKVEKIFPHLKVVVIQNPYLLEQKNSYEILRDKVSKIDYEKRILVVTEGLDEYESSHISDYASKDLEVLKKIVLQLKKLQLDNRIIRIRLHPTENQNKYSEYLEESKINFEFSNKLLSEDLAESSAVFGRRSFALVVSSVCDVPTYSLLNRDEPNSLTPSHKVIALE